MATKISSRKGKSRRLQNHVKEKLLEQFNHLEDGDIMTAPMGLPGEDIILSPLARKSFPYSVECKNAENVNIYEAIEQSKRNSKQYTPVVVIKRNYLKPPWAFLPLHSYMELNPNESRKIPNHESDRLNIFKLVYQYKDDENKIFSFHKKDMKKWIGIPFPDFLKLVK